MQEAMRCVTVLTGYLNLLGNSSYFAKFKLQTHLTEGRMRLDPNAVRGLELFESSSGSEHCSLFGLLNRCRSNGGQKLLEEWIRQPLTDLRKIGISQTEAKSCLRNEMGGSRQPLIYLRKIDERLDVVELLVGNTEIRVRFHEELLGQVPDLYKLSKRLVQKKANLQDCYRIYQLARLLPKLIESLQELASQIPAKGASSATELLAEPLMASAQSFSKFVELVDSTIDLAYFSSCGEFRIKPEFDEHLLELSEEMKTLVQEMNRCLEKSANMLGLDTGKGMRLDSAAQTGYFFRVTQKDEKVLRGNKHFHVLDAQKGGVRFTNDRLSALNEKYVATKTDYEDTQRDIVSHIMDIAVGYVEPLKTLCGTLSLLDVLVSFAVVAISAPAPFCRPDLLEKGSGILNLKGSRHPCIEATDQTMSFISNDVMLSKDDCRMAVVTGPNMGGKSTYLRQTALTCLMAQMGCFVPCDRAEMSVLDGIYTRIGAADDQMRGISTFMAEMLDSAVMLEAATENSLMVIDELGRGTSTYDGFGLAWAIAQHIATETRCLCLFATHFHEMTALARETPGVKNLRVAALTDGGEFTLLYEVQPGVSDQSFGIQIAEMLKYPKEVVQAAWEKLQELENENNTSKSRSRLDELTEIYNQDPANIQAMRNCLEKMNDP